MYVTYIHQGAVLACYDLGAGAASRQALPIFWSKFTLYFLPTHAFTRLCAGNSRWGLHCIDMQGRTGRYLGGYIVWSLVGRQVGGYIRLIRRMYVLGVEGVGISNINTILVCNRGVFMENSTATKLICKINRNGGKRE